MESESTATTWLPAPTANRSSVPAGDSETIRRGRWEIVTAAATVLILTGKPADRATDVLDEVWVELPQAETRTVVSAAAKAREWHRNRAFKRIMGTSAGREGRWFAGCAPRKPPFLRGLCSLRHRAGDLARPRLGHH